MSARATSITTTTMRLTLASYVYMRWSFTVLNWDMAHVQHAEQMVSCWVSYQMDTMGSMVLVMRLSQTGHLVNDMSMGKRAGPEVHVAWEAEYSCCCCCVWGAGPSPPTLSAIS